MQDGEKRAKKNVLEVVIQVTWEREKSLFLHFFFGGVSLFDGNIDSNV
jgi:hypothetical protein